MQDLSKRFFRQLHREFFDPSRPLILRLVYGFFGVTLIVLLCGFALVWLQVVLIIMRGVALIL